MRENSEVGSLLAISLIGLVLSLLFITPKTELTPNNSSVFLLFALICLMGATATIFPHICGHRDLPDKLDAIRYIEVLDVKLIHGHHKLCSGFKTHEIEFYGKSICAACLGLLIGALLAVIISFHHFIMEVDYTQEVGYLGVFFTLLGLIYIPVLKPEKTLLRTLYNLLFVVGFALILVVVDNSGDISFDYLIIGLSVFWMYTRIQLSNWGHNQICSKCSESCENQV